MHAIENTTIENTTNMKKTIKIIITIIITFTLISCGSSKINIEDLTFKKENLTFNIGIPEPIKTTVPYNNPTYVDNVYLSGVFEGLFMLNESGEIVPSLAQEYKISSDSKKYTVTLKEGIKFHDGEILSAQVVKENFDFFIELENNRGLDKINTVVESVTVKNEKTVEFNLKKPYSFFILKLTMPDYFIQSPNQINVSLEEYYPIGTGQFKHNGIDENGNYVLEKYVDYRDSTSNIEQVKFIVIEDDLQKIKSIETGMVDYIVNMNPGIIVIFDEDRNWRVIPGGINEMYYIEFNTNNEILKNKKVRKAIAYAIDNEAIIEKAFNDSGDINLSPIIKGGVFYKELSSYSYDNITAYTLLKEVGYNNGFDFTIAIVDNETNKIAANIIKENLELIQINTEILYFSEYEMNLYLLGGNKPDAIIGLTHNAYDTDYNIRTNYYSESTYPAGNNLLAYKNDNIDKLIVEYNKITTPEEVKKNITEISEKLWDELPKYIINNYFSSDIVNNYIENIYYTPTGILRYTDALIKTDKIGEN